MTAVPVLLGAFKRSLMPEFRCVNVLSEKDGEGRDVLVARPGLEAFETVGTAPIRCMFSKAGLFDSSALIVARETLYGLASSGALTTYTGTISGDNIVDIDAGLDADGDAVARIANGDALYKVVGGVVSIDPFVNSGICRSIQYYKGYWLGVDVDTEILYWLEPTGVTWSALNFAGADYGPDPLIGVRVFGDVFALLGSQTVEIWRATGDATSELEPYGGLNSDFGCRALASAVNCAGTLVFVDSNCSVRSGSGADFRIVSDKGLAEQIRLTPAADLRATFLTLDQHPLYILTLGTRATWVYDLSNERWTRFESAGLDYFRAHLACSLGETVLVADAISNEVFRLDPERRTDGDDTFTVKFPVSMDIAEGSAPIANFQIHCQTGFSPRSGQGSDPKLVVRISRDGGLTWGQPREVSLGTTGDFDKRVRLNALGIARGPHGVIFLVSVSDPVGRRFTRAMVNAA